MLEDWLAPLTPSDFFRGAWGKEECLFPHAAVPFGLSDFEQLLNDGPLRFPQVSVVDANGRVDTGLYTRSTPAGLDPALDPQKLHTLMIAGKTITIGKVQTVHAGMRDFVSALSDAFGCTVNVNAYYCRGPAGGMKPHYDSHHIFAVQIAGAKRWEVGPMVVDTPNRHYQPVVPAPDRPERQLTVQAGQTLYMPPGLWHRVHTDDVSLHLTVGIHPPLWSDALRGLVRRAEEMHPLLRDHLPFIIDEGGHCVYATNLKADLTEILNQLIAELPDTVELVSDRTQPAPGRLKLVRPAPQP